MEKVFIYWDNSNIFISAQQAAIDQEGETARYRTRIHFRNLLELAHGGREIERAIAVGSVPPELRHVWNRLENEGVTVQLLERGAIQGGEQGVDQTLQTAMLRDGFRYNGDPGIVVMLTGDGAGYADGVGFHADLELMHDRGWRIEALSWRRSCSRRMREWAQENGKFIALDDFYDSITFLEVAFRFRWFSCRMAANTGSEVRGRDAAMGLLYDLETRLEQQIPVQLQQSLQQALDDYQPLCPDCGLAMHRHHRYARTITTRYGAIRLQMPVFRCGQCGRMASGADLLGEAERHQRYSKKPAN